MQADSTQGTAQVVIAGRIVGSEFNRLPIAVDRLIVSAQIVVTNAQSHDGMGALGSKSDGRPHIPNSIPDITWRVPVDQVASQANVDPVVGRVFLLSPS